MEINTICCGKDMFETNFNSGLDTTIISSKYLVCLKCGNVMLIQNLQLDDEEFLNTFESFDEIKESKIYKEIEGDLKEK